MTEINIVKRLIEEYGGRDTTVGTILDYLLNITPYKCPSCDGLGKTKETYNAYPSGLPDSGFVYQEGVRYHICELCNGIGYTQKKYVPKMIDGWKVED